MSPLEPSAQRLFDLSMRWTDALWDENLGLVKAPDDSGQHTVRNTAWYALGLYRRGDSSRAERALRAVLRYQYDTPDKVYHGTFKRAPLEPDPPEVPIIWRGYDPNWREFIGTTFLVILKDFEVAEDLRSALWDSLRLAAEGALKRDVEAAYTNIALMSAFLLDHVGEREGRSAWRAWAEAKARAVYDLYAQHDAFWEYNSPTYYGTDLYALALWRRYSLSDTFHDLGARMEAGLWQDIGAFYHAGLCNLCGPFDRSYGMDMTRYLALVGLYIALVAAPERAPVPDFGSDFGHAHDFMFGPLVAHVGTEIPGAVREALLEFGGERNVRRTVEAGRVATAFLTDDLMLGAETAHPSRLPDEQFHAATAHWRLGEGVGWLRVTAHEPFSAAVDGSVMTLSLPAPRRLTLARASEAEVIALEPGLVRLSGLEIALEPKRTEVAQEKETLVLEAPAGDLRLTFKLS